MHVCVASIQQKCVTLHHWIKCKQLLEICHGWRHPSSFDCLAFVVLITLIHLYCYCWLANAGEAVMLLYVLLTWSGVLYHRATVEMIDTDVAFSVFLVTPKLGRYGLDTVCIK